MSDKIIETRQNLLQEVIARCSGLSIPVQAILELTYHCNLRCVHCYVDVVENDELTLDEWKNAIDQLKSAGTVYLLFTGGEVLIRDDFLDIATYARRAGFFIGLLTNATMITPDLARHIADLKPFGITTSLFGASAATHERVTRVAGSFERTIEGIRSLVAAGQAPLVQTLIMNYNVQELPQIEALVTSLGADSSIDIGLAPSKTGADYPFRCEPSIEQLAACGWRPDVTDVADIGQHDKWGLCKAGKAMCSVSPDGTVSPCPVFPLKLGNLRRSNFEAFWRLEPCAELRYLRSMRRTDLYACHQCDLEAYCRRCTGITYLESGRCDGPSPNACRQAQMRQRLNQATEVTSCPKKPT
jgi:radical SAM protein with 4Fe4S-binding SPASM domain